MKELTDEVYKACLSIVKHHKKRVIIFKNFGLIKIWVEDMFSTKGIGQPYNELTGQDITNYMSNYDFYSASGKSILEQAQGTDTVTIKFGHDDYIRIMEVQ